MDIKHLNYFVTVVEEGNISAAAKKLNICQPPLSHQIKTLEQKLGVRLLIRGSRKVTLTDAGQALYKKAKGLISQMNALDGEIMELKNGQNGTLTLGLDSSCGYADFGKLIVEYYEKNPNITLRFISGGSNAIVASVLKKEHEIGIVRTPFKHEGLHNVVLQKEPMVVVYGDKYLTSIKRNKVSLADLKNIPLILFRSHKEFVQNIFHENNLDPEILCLSEDPTLSTMWVKNGLGVALLPASIVKTSGLANELNVADFDSDALTTEVKLIYAANFTLSTIAKSFISELKEVK